MLLIRAKSDDEVVNRFLPTLLRAQTPYRLLQVDHPTPESIELSSDTLHVGNEVVKLDSVSAVWNRGPQSATRPNNADYAFSLALSRLETRPVVWLNPRAAIERGEERLGGLSIAAKVGFDCPNTWVTNEPGWLNDLLPGRTQVVAKPYLAVDAGKGRPAAATVTLPFQGTAAEQQIPVIYQTLLRTAYQVRVTCIGTHVLCARLDVDQDGLGVDSRASLRAGKRYEAMETPQDLKDLCQALMRELGVEYLALDVGRSEAGGWCLFDINILNDVFWIERYCPAITVSDALLSTLQARTSLLGPRVVAAQ